MNDITSIGIGDSALSSDNFQRILDVTSYGPTLTVDEIKSRLDNDYPATDYLPGQQVVVNGMTFYVDSNYQWASSGDGVVLTGIQNKLAGIPATYKIITPTESEAKAAKTVASVSEIPNDAAVRSIWRDDDGVYYLITETGVTGIEDLIARMAVGIAELVEVDSRLEESYQAADASIAQELNVVADNVSDLADEFHGYVDTIASDFESIQDKIVDVSKSVNDISVALSQIQTTQEVSAGFADSTDLVKIVKTVDGNRTLLTADNSSLKTKLSGVDASIAELKATVDGTKDKVDTSVFEKAITDINSSVAFLKTSFNDLSSNIAAKDASRDAKEASLSSDIAAVLSRVEILESADASMIRNCEESAILLGSDITELEDALDALSTSVGTKLTGLDSSIASLDGVVAQHTTGLAAVNASVSSIENAIAAINEQLTEQGSVSNEAIGTVVGDVSSLAQNVATLSTSVDSSLQAISESLTDAISDVESEIDAKHVEVTGLINSVSTGLSDLDSSVAGLASRINAVESSLNSSLSDKISDVDDEITNINSSIQTLDGKIESVIEDIQAEATNTSSKFETLDASLQELAESTQAIITSNNEKFSAVDSSLQAISESLTDAISDVESEIDAKHALHEDIETAIIETIESGFVTVDGNYIDASAIKVDGKTKYTLDTAELEDKFESVDEALIDIDSRVKELEDEIYGSDDHVKNITDSIIKSQKEGAIKIETLDRIPVNAPAGSIYVIEGVDKDLYFEVQPTGTFGILQTLGNIQESIESLDASREDSVVVAHPSNSYVTVTEVEDASHNTYVVNDTAVKVAIDEVTNLIDALAEQVDDIANSGGVPDHVLKDLYGDPDHVEVYKNPDEDVRREAVENYLIDSSAKIPYTAPTGRVYAINEINPSTGNSNYSFVKIGEGTFGIVKGVEYLAGKVDEIEANLDGTAILEEKLYGMKPKFDVVPGFNAEDGAAAINLESYDDPLIYQAVTGECYRVKNADGIYEHIRITEDGSTGTFYEIEQQFARTESKHDADISAVDARIDALNKQSINNVSVLTALINNTSGNINITLEQNNAEINERIDDLETSIDDVSKYQSTLNDTIKTTTVNGDIPKGTTVAELKTMTVHEILTKMLFKDYQPTATNPAIALTAPADKSVYEFGTSLSNASFGVSTTAGYVKCQTSDGITWDGVDKQWSNFGAVTYNIGGDVKTGTFNYVAMTPGPCKVKASVPYTVNNAAWNGMTSQGNNATVSKSAGTATSVERTLYFIKPVFANGEFKAITDGVIDAECTTTTMQKATPVSDGVYVVNFASQAATGQPYELYVPASANVNWVVQSQLTGKWDSTIEITFTKTSETKTVTTVGNNSDRNYAIWRYSNPDAGSAKIKFTIS